MSSFLGGASSARGKLANVNMVTIVGAIVLSVMTIVTHNSCIDDPKQFPKSSSVKFMYVVAILILVMALMLFGYDMGVMFKIIKS